MIKDNTPLELENISKKQKIITNIVPFQGFKSAAAATTENRNNKFPRKYTICTPLNQFSI